MPSHTSLKPDASKEEAVWHGGNEAVDKAAGDRRQLEEERAGKDRLAEAEVWCKTAANGLKAVGSILSLWPTLPRAMARKLAEPKWALKVEHEWHFSHYRNYWRCKACGCFSTTDEQAGPPRKYGKCQPGRLQERLEQAESLGHDVKVVQVQGVPTFYCTLCAARGSWQWRKLLQPCTTCPRSADEHRWLQLAEEGGQRLSLQRTARQKRTEATKSREQRPRKPYKRRNGQLASEGHLTANPLRNMNAASGSDRNRWASLDNGLCRMLPPTLPPPSTATSSSLGLVDHSQPLQRSAAPVELLSAFVDDPDGAEEECPRCYATVLPTDLTCAQCGLERKELCPETPVIATNPAGAALVNSETAPDDRHAGRC